MAQQIDNLVVIDTCFDELPVDFVVMNNYMGRYQAASHLLKLGHKKIGYVQSKTRMYNFDRRRQGFVDALREQGLEINKSHVFSLPPTIVTSQEEFKRKFAELGNDIPTALFCECDYMAISTIKSLAEMNIRVTEDVSVIGFDDISEAQIISPELTTIHVEKETIATIAVQSLIQRIEDRQNQTAVTQGITVKTNVATRLVERISCANVNKESSGSSNNKGIIPLTSI